MSEIMRYEVNEEWAYCISTEFANKGGVEGLQIHIDAIVYKGEEQ